MKTLLQLFAFRKYLWGFGTKVKRSERYQNAFINYFLYVLFTGCQCRACPLFHFFATFVLFIYLNIVSTYFLIEPFFQCFILFFFQSSLADLIIIVFYIFSVGIGFA